jgi:outer membrane protein insertion porin family
LSSKRVSLLAWLVLLAPPSLALAQADPTDFVVSDIVVEGLQRVSEGTVYNYLPVNIGDRLSTQRVREAVRALYATGFFRDVEVRRDGSKLVIAVVERASIESFEIKGNKDIKTEDMTKSLRNVGLAAGKTFDRSVLEDVKQYLTDQYYSRGKYAVRVDAQVEELSGNRVKVKIDIKEGKRAKIRQINLVGNSKFADKKVLESFELKTPNWLSWYKQDDRYSRESLQGDLEKLRSYYMDRGYANFQVDSTQVAIAPEKDDIFITINIDEGDVYKVSSVKLAGNFIVPEAQLREFLLVQPGQIFSRKQITSTQELIQNRLGADGYAFAKVDPVPTADEDKKQISITFMIDPGNRVYVRHINFTGITRTNDEVLRREMRQLEGGWLSNVAVDRSKQRLQRLPYIEKVESETTPVPGSPDLVDVTFDVKEGPSSQLGGGIGYSESQSFILNGSYTDSNFAGSGERLAVELNGGRYSKVYSISHTNPYMTIDGIARTYSISYRDVTQFVSSSSALASKTFSAGVDYGYPITEFQGLRAGLSLQQADLVAASSNSAIQAQQWIRSNGRPHVTTDSNLTVFPDPTDRGVGVVANDPTGITTIYGTRFHTLEAIIGWNWDTRNRGLFADRGMHNSISLSSTIPSVSDVQYWTVEHQFLQYVPVWKGLTMSFETDVAYGKELGNTSALPPYRNFFVGGPDSVRGFRESRLGPKDNFGNPYGGNFKVVGRAELIFPTPEKWRSSARVSWFYDIGNVFSTSRGYTFYGRDSNPLVPGSGTPVDYRFKVSELKRSTGIAVQWLAPLGIFRFSFGIPLNASRGTNVLYPDEKESFQFSVGQAF